MNTAESLNRLESGITVIDNFFDNVFAPLTAWMPKLTDEITTQLDRSGKMTGAQLTQLVEQDSKQLVTETEHLVYGAGFCGSDYVVKSGNPLAWWQGSDLRLLASSTFGPGQAEIDLSRLEWYRVPRATNQAHVAGPFVDYLCSNEVTVTLSLPLTIRGQFAGVACADVLVATLEKELQPLLNLPEQSALLNTSGRIVLASDFDGEPGDRHPAASFSPDEAAAQGLRIARSTRYPYLLVSQIFSKAAA